MAGYNGGGEDHFNPACLVLHCRHRLGGMFPPLFGLVFMFGIIFTFYVGLLTTAALATGIRGLMPAKPVAVPRSWF